MTVAWYLIPVTERFSFLLSSENVIIDDNSLIQSNHRPGWEGTMDDVWVADVDDGAHSTYFPNAMPPTPIARTLDRQGKESKTPSLCDVSRDDE